MPDEQKPHDAASNRWLNTDAIRGDDYDKTYIQREAAGQNVHGEADFVESYSPRSVLDAGCGTGRVGIELARRGIEVVGVDIDPGLLTTATNKAPDLEWHLSDLATVDLGRTFDAIVMAGNGMIFLPPGTEGAGLKNPAPPLPPRRAPLARFHLTTGYPHPHTHHPTAPPP